MRFVNLVGVALVLCQLAFSVSAGSISSSAPSGSIPADVYGYIYKDGIILDNIKVHVKVKRICSSSYWQDSNWSYPDGFYYYGPLSEGWYLVQVQAFQLGTSTYKSCVEPFRFNGTEPVDVDLDIYSLNQIPAYCGGTDLPC